jgi:hypothetical protein
MTRPTTVLLSVFAAVMIAAVPANAQTPAEGQNAAGVDIGVLLPDDAFENTLAIDGFVEHYFTARTSVRAMLAWANPGVDNQTEDHFRETSLLFNVVYNWEGGVLHPFVTAGAGAYFVRLKREDRPDPDGETRGGINLGGGIEYFTGARTTVKAEGRFDIVSHPPGLPDATGLTLTVGLKHYF